MPSTPFFSLIIPTYNRPQQLAACLKAITGLTYPAGAFEVIVVDDGSSAGLEETVDLFCNQINIQLFKKKNEGPASARNFGAAKAKGNYLAFTDDDCLPARDWLSRMAEQLERTPDCLLGGQTVNQLKDNIFSAASQLIVDIVYDHYNRQPDKARFFASNNLVAPAGIFAEIGSFSGGWRTSEDRELCDRWLWKGHKMIYVEQAIVYHRHNLNLFSYCRQHFAYGKGAFHFHRIREKRQSGTMAQEMGFHTNLSNWLLAPFTRHVHRRLSIFFLLALWQIANLAGFLWAAWFERSKYQ